MTALVLRIVGSGGYLGIALLMALENIFPPIPSEVIMGTGGILVAHQRMSFVALVAAGTIGSTAGNYAWYWVGRRFGLERLRPLVERHGRWLTLSWADVERVDRFFRRHGDWLIFAARFSPAFRTVISLPAGLVAMPRWRFLVWTAAGTTVWNIFLAGAGYYLGTRFRAAEGWVGPATAVLIALIVAAYLWRVVTWRPR